AIAAYTEPVAMMQGGLLVVGLLALRETSRLWLQDEISLMVNSRTATIEFKQAGQPYFFCKYKVYATRWFAILKLIDNRNTRTLILNSDRFNSIQTYRQLRLVLQTMDRTDAA
ncbi:MAG: hypothetical protein GY802_30085, partial [Gammaproteobacteria bacterium]|nr:hypothetical protein [Gammaproteobacteria bacterium]